MRSKSEADLSDVFVWTNTRVIKWVNSIGTFYSNGRFFKNDAYLEIKAWLTILKISKNLVFMDH